MSFIHQHIHKISTDAETNTLIQQYVTNNNIINQTTLDTAISAINLPIILRKTSDQTFNNDTSLDPITDLSFDAQAGAVYKVKTHLHITTQALAGAKAAFGGTATITAARIAQTLYNASSSSLSVVASVSNITTVVGAISVGTTVLIEMEGIIQVNQAGTVGVEGAQQAGILGNTVFLTNSFLEYIRIS